MVERPDLTRVHDRGGAPDGYPSGVSRAAFRAVRLSGVDFAGRRFEALSFGGRCTLETSYLWDVAIDHIGWGNGSTLFRSLPFPSILDLRDDARNNDASSGAVLTVDWKTCSATLASSLTAPSTVPLLIAASSADPGAGESRLRRRRNEFKNNDFTGARFTTTKFRCGISLHTQRFPDHVLVLRDGRTALQRFEGVVTDLGDDAPQVLVGWVRAWRLEVDEGQTEAFFNPDDLPPMPVAAREMIISAAI